MLKDETTVKRAWGCHVKSTGGGSMHRMTVSDVTLHTHTDYILVCVHMVG